MSLGITIDWDYFTPYDSMWDIQHVESLLYLDFIWKTRGYLTKLYKTSGEERSFWPWLHEHFGTEEELLTVSDSHASIVKDGALWRETETIISFDQHHDCWPTDDDNRDDDGRIVHVACHTWGRAWLEEHASRRLVWVYPDHLDISEYGDFDDPTNAVHGVRNQLTVLPRKDFDPSYYEGEFITGVHLCRSGCWTPPWLDSAFRKFVHDSGLLKEVLQHGQWDPMRLRWTREDMAEAQRMYEESRRAFDEIHKMEEQLANQREG